MMLMACTQIQHEHRIQHNKKTLKVIYPITPFFGGLLLNWRVDLCLNLGGPLWGLPGPVTRMATLLLALGLETSI